MFLNLLSSGIYFSDTFEPIAKWLTVGIIGAILLGYLITFLANKSLAKTFIKKASVGFIFYALVLGIFMLVLEILKKFDTAYLEENWVSLDVISFVLIPLLVTLSLSLIGGVTIFVLTKNNRH